MRALTAERIREALAGIEAGAFGATVQVRAQTESTQDVLRELAEQGAPEGTVVITDEQTAGRGRMGRAWVAPPRTSLLLSILFRPALPPSEAQRPVMATGLAAAEACESLADVRVDVKWPNDLQIDGRKLAGLLPDSAIRGERLDWVLIGLGLNVHQRFEAGDPLAIRATSLDDASGQMVDRAALLAQILARLNAWNARLDDPALVEAWRARCVTLGQRVQIATAGGSVEGLAEEIDASGALWLRSDDGRRQRVLIGEATVVG